MTRICVKCGNEFTREPGPEICDECVEKDRVRMTLKSNDELRYSNFKMVGRQGNKTIFMPTIGKIKHGGRGRPVVQFKKTTKISGKTKLPTEEFLMIDRREKRKRHKIIEYGTKPKIVHDEDKELK